MGGCCSKRRAVVAQVRDDQARLQPNAKRTRSSEVGRPAPRPEPSHVIELTDRDREPRMAGKTSVASPAAKTEPTQPSEVDLAPASHQDVSKFFRAEKEAETKLKKPLPPCSVLPTCPPSEQAPPDPPPSKDRPKSTSKLAPKLSESVLKPPIPLEPAPAKEAPAKEAPAKEASAKEEKEKPAAEAAQLSVFDAKVVGGPDGASVSARPAPAPESPQPQPKEEPKEEPKKARGRRKADDATPDGADWSPRRPPKSRLEPPPQPEPEQPPQSPLGRKSSDSLPP